jgi:hypothetical protein
MATSAGGRRPELVSNVNEPPGRTEPSRLGEVSFEFSYLSTLTVQDGGNVKQVGAGMRKSFR